MVISNDINNKIAATVTVIPITSQIEKIYPFEVVISSLESGLAKDSKAKCNQIRTIDKKRLIKCLGKISLEKHKDVEKALSIHLGFY